ncbi:anti-sigma factor family protein [Bythopirellula polymerisocia]|uniref:Zinc-finger domain-containing protein n=1 Tax=Bythopirellula polymerisocia TaxID=2528003 RepID=A0A5C6CFE9_9BACT|nr:hypothetical protein [Bythopirellula polymerisocia]TWU22745.1 hypothetical protein Pla144_42060 [Bythopirellula polymerisocia]
MNSEHGPIRDDQFEAYLDGTLSEAERAVILDQLQSDEDRRLEVELQGKIDEALRKSFPVVAAPEGLFLLTESDEALIEDQRRFNHRRWWVGGAVAAALIGLLLSWWGLDSGKPVPFFEPVPLAQIYRDTLQNGFHPYYECHDDKRFADIFATRQGMPMHLSPMPEGTRMLGLSYPGGLSRDTTAMLCMVDDAPVMVFVDHAEVDNKIAKKDAVPKVNVFRAERDGLVIYEVSELDEPRAMKFLEVGPAPADAE